MISVSLIVAGFYNILLSVNTLLFIYPHLNINSQTALTIEAGLIDKALIIYFTMIIDSGYGLALLFKPMAKIKTFHLLIGALIFIISIFLITKTPFTTNPVVDSILQLTI